MLDVDQFLRFFLFLKIVFAKKENIGRRCRLATTEFFRLCFLFEGSAVSSRAVVLTCLTALVATAVKKDL